MSAFDISGGVPPHVLHNDVDFSAHQQERYVMKAKNSLAMKVALAATLSGVVAAGGGLQHSGSRTPMGMLRN